MAQNDDRLKQLKYTLERTEVFRADIMREINLMGGNTETYTPVSVYPMANISHFVYKDYPIYQFSYEGALPPYRGMSKKYLQMISNYYHSATVNSMDFFRVRPDIKPDASLSLNKVGIIFAHYFSDMRIRDFDNRNKKYVLDAIKNTDVIYDDSWIDIWTMDMGFLDQNYNHLQVFIIPQDIFFLFAQNLSDNPIAFSSNKRCEGQIDYFKSHFEY